MEGKTKVFGNGRFHTLSVQRKSAQREKVFFAHDPGGKAGRGVSNRGYEGGVET